MFFYMTYEGAVDLALITVASLCSANTLFLFRADTETCRHIYTHAHTRKYAHYSNPGSDGVEGEDNTNI